MESSFEERKQQLEAFSAFIDESYARIDEMLHSVGWSRDHLIKEEMEMVCCPLNPGHKVPKTSLDSHLQLCSWHQEGYHQQDVPLPESFVVNSECVKSSIILDASMHTTVIREAKRLDPLLQTGNLESEERLVPKTSQRLIADFTSDERRVIYDYVISKTTPVEDVKVEELQMIGDIKKDEKSRPKTKLELMIEQRNAKRRRISYRKKVHTNRKSHTEIIREVIQNQMELLEQIIRGDCDEDVDDDDNDEHGENENHGDKDDTYSLYSLGGAERNLVSMKHRDNIKNHMDYKNTERNEKRETYIDEEGIRKNKECIASQSKKIGAVSKYSEKEYDKNEQHSEILPERSKIYGYKNQYNSYEKKGWDDKRDFKKPSSSFQDRTYKNRLNTNYHKVRDRSRDNRTYDKTKSSYENRQNFEELEEYNKTKQFKDVSKHDKSKHKVEYKEAHHYSSRYYKSASKRRSPEGDLEYEKEHYNQTKHYKYSSKYDSSEWGNGKYLEMKKEPDDSREASADDNFNNEYSDCSHSRNDVHSSGLHHDRRIHKECDERFLQPEEKELKTKEFKKEDVYVDSRKYSEKLKTLKKKKKKKKKHHKHKVKKSKKKYHSSSSNSSKSSSEKSENDSDSD